MLIIQDGILVSNPLAVDASLSNTYSDGETIVIETVEEYLQRIPRALRKVGFPITFYNEPGIITKSDFADIQTEITVSYYIFSDGVEDENLIPFTYGSDTSYLEKHDITFDYHDVEGTGTFTYVLDPKASWPYIVEGLVINSDDIIDTVRVTWEGYNGDTGAAGGNIFNRSVPTSNLRNEYDLYDMLPARNVAENIQVGLVITTVDRENTFITGKLKIKRYANSI